jgi:hypothetical protein
MKANRMQGVSQNDTPMDYRQRAKDASQGLGPYAVAERAAEMGREAAKKSKAKLTKKALGQIDQNA